MSERACKKMKLPAANVASEQGHLDIAMLQLGKADKACPDFSTPMEYLMEAHVVVPENPQLRRMPRPHFLQRKPSF